MRKPRVFYISTPKVGTTFGPFRPAAAVVAAASDPGDPTTVTGPCPAAPHNADASSARPSWAPPRPCSGYAPTLPRRSSGCSPTRPAPSSLPVSSAGHTPGNRPAGAPERGWPAGAPPVERAGRPTALGRRPPRRCHARQPATTLPPPADPPPPP